jgi:hypothetical protein
LAVYARPQFEKPSAFLNAPSLPGIEAARQRARHRGMLDQDRLKRGIDGQYSFGEEATRKIARRTAVNKARRSRVRIFVRKVEEAIASGD